MSYLGQGHAMLCGINVNINKFLSDGLIFNVSYHFTSIHEPMLIHNIVVYLIQMIGLSAFKTITILIERALHHHDFLFTTNNCIVQHSALGSSLSHTRPCKHTNCKMQTSQQCQWYLDGKRSSEWLESWQGLLLPTTALLRTPVTQMIFFNQGMLLLVSNHFLDANDSDWVCITSNSQWNNLMTKQYVNGFFLILNHHETWCGQQAGARQWFTITVDTCIVLRSWYSFWCSQTPCICEVLHHLLKHSILVIFNYPFVKKYFLSSKPFMLNSLFVFVFSMEMKTSYQSS